MYKMIYEEITFTANPFRYDLEFDDRFTLVGGDSGTGKTFLYNLLDDLKLTEQYKAIRLFNYRSEDVERAIKKCRNCFIVVDNADILLINSIKHYMNFEFTNQYMLFGRNCDGLFLSEESFKVLHEENYVVNLRNGY